MLKAALAYAVHLGWSVFPCRGKVPAIPENEGGRGCLDATVDEAVITAWWSGRYPRANIGLAAGAAAGFFAVDLDVKKDGRTAFADIEEEHGFLPETVEQITPTGGRHMLLRYPPTIEIPNSVSRIRKGVDIRGASGYIIGAPSIHPDTKTAYAWHPDLHPLRVAIAEAPEWLIDLAKAPEPEEIVVGQRPLGRLSRYGEAALDNAVKRILTAPNLEQEATLTGECFAIGRLAGGGVIPAGLAIESLYWAARQIPSYDQRKPWRARELDRKVRDRFTAGLRQPRGVPDARS
jgi:hypothetical protein